MSWPLLVFLLLLAWLVWDWVLAPLLGAPQTTPWELRSRLDEGEKPYLLDVRTPTEHRWFRLPGAVNRPWPVDPSQLDIPKDMPIVVVCMTGHRSLLAVRRLQKAGFTNVSNLTWGTVAWRLLGNSVEKGEQSDKGK